MEICVLRKNRRLLQCSRFEDSYSNDEKRDFHNSVH